MLGHIGIKKYILQQWLLLAVVLLHTQCLCAARITQIVEFSTTQTGGVNQLDISGKLDTLAQGLREVNFGATNVAAQGTLRAELTFETSARQPPVLLGVKFLNNSFEQGAVALFYDVPNTTRRVSFSANNLKFSLDLDDIPVNDEPQNLLSANLMVAQGSLTMHPSAYQMVQNQGVAEIAITNRPSKQQNLFEQQITSAYVPTDPIPLLDLADFTLTPLANGSSDFLASLSIPMRYQQLRYAGVGLPVTLSYSGTLQLAGVAIINNTVPEPSALLLAGMSAGCMLLRRGRKQL